MEKMSPINVLVADDSQTVREVILKTLKVAGILTNTVFEAENGQQALDLLDDEWIDLVISDINMPVMNGIEMIERMQSNELTKTIPVIVVTTEGSQKRITQLAEKGVKAYIRKPFSPEQIREIVGEVLEGQNLAHAHREVLTTVFQDVTEKMTFIFAETLSMENLPESVVDPVETRISFTGPHDGLLTLTVSKQLCPTLAANTIGIDERDESAAAKGLDALKELLNVVCGNLLTEIAGESPLFELSIPEVRELTTADWLELRKRPGTVAFYLDDHPAVVRFVLRSGSTDTTD